MTTIDVCSEQKFELEAIAVKEGHFIKNLKRRHFKLVGDCSSPSNRSLFLYYGADKEHATNVTDLLGAQIIERTVALGNFSSEHVLAMNLDRKRNSDKSYFAMCFDSASMCSEWKSCIHSFNSATSSAAETRDYLALIQESSAAGSLPVRPLATLRNLCVRNAVYRAAVTTSDSGVDIVISLLHHDDADMQLCALTIVTACCDTQHRAQAFQAAGVLPALLRCTQTKEHSGSAADGSSGHNSDAALTALAQMCSASTGCQDALKDAAGLNLFLKVMSLMRGRKQDALLLKKLVRIGLKAHCHDAWLVTSRRPAASSRRRTRTRSSSTSLHCVSDICH
jgi:hypothetical protein